MPRQLLAEALTQIRVEPAVFSALIRHLESAPIAEVYAHYEVIIEATLVSLDTSACSVHVGWQLAKLWRRLANLIPRKLYEQTLRLWLNTPQAATNGPIDVDNALLMGETPALLFRVDERVFRSPPHFDLLMTMLSFYLEATKNFNNMRLNRAAALQEPPQ